MNKILVTLLMLCTAECVSCPLCDSETASAIREYTFGPELHENLTAVLSPFFILSGLLYLYNTSKKRSEDE